jgi:hypothetical protein
LGRGRERVLTSGETLSAFILSLESEAQQRLAAASGGQSLCTLSRGTDRLPSLKYFEGMAAAFAEARRAIRRLPDSSHQDFPEVIRDIRDRWAAQSSAPGHTGWAWTDYLAGGVDAGERLLAECS